MKLFYQQTNLNLTMLKIKPNFVANLLRDRFESLQRRGALAASKVMMKKKRKLKSYFKPGHKVTEKDIEKYVNRNVKKK